MLKDSVQGPNLSSMMLTNPLPGFLVPDSGRIFIYHFVMKVSGVFLSVVLSILIHISKKGPFSGYHYQLESSNIHRESAI